MGVVCFNIRGPQKLPKISSLNIFRAPQLDATIQEKKGAYVSTHILYIYTYTCLHTHTHIYIYIYIYIYMHAYNTYA